jgi:hypothetical protein
MVVAGSQGLAQQNFHEKHTLVYLVKVQLTSNFWEVMPPFKAWLQVKKKPPLPGAGFGACYCE